MKKLSLAALLFIFVCAGCGESDKREEDTPAGHPDELKDSTRLDAAPKPGDSTSSTSGETAKPKKKYRFSS